MADQFVGQKINNLPTPCLLIRQSLLERNIRWMADQAKKNGKAVRPHCKTHKSASIAELQLKQDGCVGVCVTTVHEAVAFHKAGVRPILITSEIASQVYAHAVAELASDMGTDLCVVVDCQTGAQLLNDALDVVGDGPEDVESVPLQVLIQVDVGQQRTGCIPGNVESLARFIQDKCPNLRLVGVQSYAGHIQHVKTQSDRYRMSSDALDIGRQAFDQVKAVVGEQQCQVLTGAGTGDFANALANSSLTDVQPGSYVCVDAEYLAIEGFHSAELTNSGIGPLTLLATVLNNSWKTHVTCDAGLKAIYADGPGPEVVLPHSLRGHCTYAHQGDEHGKISLSKEVETAPEVGSKIQLIVSHCDPTVSLHDFMFVIDDNDKVVDVFPIDARGHCL